MTARPPCDDALPTHEILGLMNEISKMLTCFDSLELSFPKILAITANIMPVHSALVIEHRDGVAKSTVWHGPGANERRLDAALTHGKEALVHLQRLAPDEAEQLKQVYGHCVVTAIPQLNEIEIGGDLSVGNLGGGQSARVIRQRFLAEILEPRARELFTMMRDNLRSGGVLEALGAGLVLTGGGAKMAGLLDNAESLLRVPARVGHPVPLSRMPEELAGPEFSVAIGMLLYTHRTQVRRASEEQGLRAKLKAIFAGSF